MTGSASAEVVDVPRALRVPPEVVRQIVRWLCPLDRRRSDVHLAYAFSAPALDDLQPLLRLPPPWNRVARQYLWEHLRFPCLTSLNDWAEGLLKDGPREGWIEWLGRGVEGAQWRAVAEDVLATEEDMDGSGDVRSSFIASPTSGKRQRIPSAVSPLPTIPNGARIVRTLDFGAYHMSPRAVYSLREVHLLAIARLPYLQELSLARAHGITDEGIARLLPLLPRLRSLDLSYIRAVDDELLLLASSCLPHLRELRVQRCLRVTDEGVWAVAEAYPDLRALDITRCRHVKGTGFGPWLAKGDREELDLRELRVEGTRVRASTIHGLVRRAGRLEDLGMEGYGTDAVLETLVGRQPLRALRMFRISRSVRELLMGNLKLFRQLRTLRLTYGQGVGAEEVGRIVEAAPFLTSLALPGCSVVSEDILSAIVRNTRVASQLQRLDLSRLRFPPQGGWEGCALPELEDLRIRSTFDLTKEALQRILEMAPRLRFLDITRSLLTADVSLERVESAQLAPSLFGACQMDVEGIARLKERLAGR